MKRNWFLCNFGVGPGVIAPVADFSANVVTGDAPVAVTFTDLSTNTPTSWDWDFGDGTAHSTDQNPVHNYTAAGTYTVSLTATNAAGDSTETKTGYITIYTTLILQPALIDTQINGTAGSETTNYGSAASIATGRAGAYFRALIKFNLTTLPADAIISATTLALKVYQDNSANARTMRVYRLKRAWVEAEATWNIYSTGNNWQTAGGFGADDCEQTEIGSRDFTATETVDEFKNITLTPVSKSALDLGNGWLLKMDVESNDRYDFYSSNYAVAANRPKLSIRYTRP